MFGTENLFYKSAKIGKVSDTDHSPHISFLQRLYQQAKQVSQIIAYIWRWVDADLEKYEKQWKVANQLKLYFKRPTIDVKDPGQNLKNLWRANPRDPNDGSEEAQLLRAVFFDDPFVDNKDYIFPIFNKFERGDDDPALGYLFEIQVNAFNGTLEDANPNLPQLFTFNIPYPPCPRLGDGTLNEEILENWIKNREKNQYFAENPYIPTTCS